MRQGSKHSKATGHVDGGKSTSERDFKTSRYADIMAAKQDSQRFTEMKHILIGEYYCADATQKNGNLFDLHDESGFKFSKDHPLDKVQENNEIQILSITKIDGTADEIDLERDVPSAASEIVDGSPVLNSLDTNGDAIEEE